MEGGWSSLGDGGGAAGWLPSTWKEITTAPPRSCETVRVMSELIRDRSHSAAKSDGTPTTKWLASMRRPAVFRSQVSKLGRVT